MGRDVKLNFAFALERRSDARSGRSQGRKTEVSELRCGKGPTVNLPQAGILRAKPSRKREIRPEQESGAALTGSFWSVSRFRSFSRFRSSCRRPFRTAEPRSPNEGPGKETGEE